jgi:hypothetical protein
LVCGRVINSTERVTEEVFDALYMIALDEAHAELKKELTVSPTFATAASVLLELIEARQELEISSRSRLPIVLSSTDFGL